MIKIKDFQPLGYYVFESLSSGRSCYFETKKEVEYFRSLIKRYLVKYVRIHKIYLSSEGYQILLRIRGGSVLKRIYRNVCLKRGKPINNDFLKEPWRIISEQVRILHSVYVKGVNKMRDRKGVLVQERYNRYLFRDIIEMESYEEGMEKKKEIKGQRNKKYRVSKRWKRGVNWALVRGVRWVESFMDRGFRDYVVSKLVNWTLAAHTSPKSP